MRKEAPVGNADTGRTPTETLDSKCGIQPRLGEEVQGVSSTGVWSPSGSRIWRPSVVVDQLPTLKLTGGWNVDPLGVTSRDPHVYGTLDGEPLGSEEAIRGPRMSSSCGTGDQGRRSYKKRVDCRKCLASRHFSKRSDECRPRWGCFVCGNTGHTQKGCPVRPAFGGGLARGLEFKSGIPRAKLIDERHDPAMKKEKASGVRMVREIQVAMGFPDPANVAVVERGQSSVGRRGYTSLRGRRGDSTPRARKRDRSESLEIFEPRRPRRHDDATTPLSKTLGGGGGKTR